MPGVGSLACYESYDQVGEGTYGYVFRAKDKRSGESVALKRLIFHKESAGFPLCGVREIKFLKSLKHKNIVALKEIVSSKGCEHLDSIVCTKNDPKKGNNKEDDVNDENKKPNDDKPKEDPQDNTIVKLLGNLYLVFEYIEHDLGGLVDYKYKFNQRALKCIMKQLFEALDYLNEKKVIHRDIKTSNILLSNYHHVKLADFGLARSAINYYDTNINSTNYKDNMQQLTNNVVTMWYKAPELLLGSTTYTNSIDIWSAGCVLAELELSRPLFPGKTEVEEFDMISRVLGYPTEENFSGLIQLCHYDTFLKTGMTKNKSYSNIFRQVYANKISEQALNLLERVFILDPEKRPSAKIILTHAYFFTYPTPPNQPQELEPLQLTPGASLHEYETKLKRRQALKDHKEESNSSSAISNTQNDTTVFPNTYMVPPIYDNMNKVEFESLTTCLPVSSTLSYTNTLQGAVTTTIPSITSDMTNTNTTHLSTADTTNMIYAHSVFPIGNDTSYTSYKESSHYPPNIVPSSGGYYYGTDMNNHIPPPSGHISSYPSHPTSHMYPLPVLSSAVSSSTHLPPPPHTSYHYPPSSGGYPTTTTTTTTTTSTSTASHNYTAQYTTPRSNISSGNTYVPQRVCTHYARGQCTYGNTCKFSHIIPENSTNTSMKINVQRSSSTSSSQPLPVHYDSRYAPSNQYYPPPAPSEHEYSTYYNNYSTNYTDSNTYSNYDYSNTTNNQQKRSRHY